MKSIKLFVAKPLEILLTALSKKLVFTSCSWGCYRPEAPEELMK